MTKPKVVSFRYNIKELYEQAGLTEKDFDEWPVEMILCESFKNLSKILEEEPVLIIAAQDMIRRHGSIEEFLLMVDTLIKFSDQKNKPAIGIGFSAEITQEEIRQAHRLGLNLFPSAIHFGRDETLKAIESFLSTGKSCPKHILNKLMNKDLPKFKDIHLTERQQQVYDLIARRGLTNKQIAQVLKISESTVKIHVSAVMRALCVRNRTQLALTK